MTRSNPIRGALERLGLGADDARSIIALCMALLTCLAAGVASLNADVGAKKAVAQRSSDQLHLQVAGRRGEVQSQIARDFAVFNLNFREIELSLAESDLAKRATEEGRRRVAELMARVDGEISTWLTTRGGLYDPRYYDAETFTHDFNTYSADLAERGVQMEQKARRDGDVAEAWDEIGNTTVTVLTLIAVALFFLGLAASIGGRARPILGVAGFVVGLVAAGWAGSLALAEVHVVPDGAINAYVRSDRELTSSGQVLGSPVSDDARGHLDAAIEAAREAVRLDARYLDGGLQLANTLATRGLALLFAPQPEPDAAQADLEQARAAYTAVLERDPKNPLAWWNIGWIHYLTGDNEAALVAADRAIELRPDNPALQLNRLEALIALGRRDDAERTLDAVIEVAVSRAGGATDYTLREADAELSRLIRLRPEAERDQLAAARDRLRVALVARRIGRDPFTLSPPAAAFGGELRAVTLDTATGELVPTEPVADGGTLAAANTHGFYVEVVPSGLEIRTDAFLSVRVWRDDEEVPDFRIDRAWSEGTAAIVDTPYGRTGAPVDPGAYRVEVFLDAVRMLSFDFQVVVGS